VISVYQLPKFRLTAAPRHVYSNQIQTEDDSNKSGSQSYDTAQFWQGHQPQSTGPVKNACYMLKTQECSRKFSSMLLSSQTSAAGHVASPGSSAVKVKSDEHHVRPACLQTVGHRKMKSFPASACTSPPRRSSSCSVARPPMVPIVNHHSARRQPSEKLTLQTNSFMIPSTARNVKQPKKDSDRPSVTNSQARRAWKAEVDDNPKSRKPPVDTDNVVSCSCNDAAVEQQWYINESYNNMNNNCLHQSDFATLQLIDHACYRPVSRQKVEAGNVASASYSDASKRRVSVAVLMQNGSVKATQFTASTAKCDATGQVAPGFLIATSDNADYGSISQSVTPELETLQPEKSVVMVKQHADDLSAYTRRPVSNSYKKPDGIKIEKCLISNKPMTICTLPVPRPAFICKSVLPETATAAKPSFSHSTTVARSYHETTRPQRHENLPLTESGLSTDQWKSAGISKLPYVGADLWELTTQRLQRVIIDKVSHKPQHEQVNNAIMSKTGCEGSSSISSATPSCSLQSTERSHNDIGRLVNKCLSAKTVRPKTELAVRASHSTSRLQQDFAEDEDEAVVDCDIELYVFLTVC